MTPDTTRTDPHLDLAALRQHTSDLLPELVSLRTALHRQPELGLQLPRTQSTVIAALDGLGLEIVTGRALTSVVAILRGSSPGPAVLLRGDMDALPVSEASPNGPGDELLSQVPGVMHACGHDLHTAGLVGAARLLAARRETVAGSVVFMFQPGEEGPGGAQPMIDEGVLDAAGDRVVAAYALHVMSAIVPCGVVICRPGPILAASDGVLVTVNGRGGHGSMPHLAADPVPVAAEIVLALQTMVTRQFDVFDPVVVSVGRIAAGSVANVIPATATIEATVRTFTEATRIRVREVVSRVCENVAAAHGLSATVDYRLGYPVTVNDPTEAARVARISGEMFGEQGFVTAPRPIPGSEDFAYLLDQVPGGYFGVGATMQGTDPSTAAYNHAPEARFDDAALAVGPAVLAALALDRLAQG